MKVLLVEDEADIAMPLQKALIRKGYAVDWKDTGTAGLAALQRSQYDVCLLDLNLPELDGIELMQQLRSLGNTTPTIMITARSQLFNTLEGFEAGTDDYITKPFHLDEVFARIEAVIRRSSTNQEHVLQMDPWTIYPDKMHCVSETMGVVDLSNKEMGVLVYLLRNKGKVISSEELLEHVWYSDVDMFTDTVKTHVKTLRKKLDPHKRYIQTVKGKGYTIR